MRRVLLIAFDYPFAAGGGVIRMTKLKKYPSICARYDRRRIAKQVASVLDKVIGQA